jgi:ankyrin repeat protein
MDRNQYKRIEGTVEEISKTYINFNDYDSKDKIEDLELGGEENVLIYRGNGNGDEFINIYSGIRIMITTERTINGDRYKKLPENVDYVIVKNRVYEVKNEFDMMKFKSEGRFREYIEELERQGKINENNKRGETALMIACYKEMETDAMRLITKMSVDTINKWNKEGETALIKACENGMERVVEMIRERCV